MDSKDSKKRKFVADADSDLLVPIDKKPRTTPAADQEMEEKENKTKEGEMSAADRVALRLMNRQAWAEGMVQKFRQDPKKELSDKEKKNPHLLNPAFSSTLMSHVLCEFLTPEELVSLRQTCSTAFCATNPIFGRGCEKNVIIVDTTGSMLDRIQQNDDALAQDQPPNWHLAIDLVCQVLRQVSPHSRWEVVEIEGDGKQSWQGGPARSSSRPLRDAPFGLTSDETRAYLVSRRIPADAIAAYMAADAKQPGADANLVLLPSPTDNRGPLKNVYERDFTSDAGCTAARAVELLEDIKVRYNVEPKKLCRWQSTPLCSTLVRVISDRYARDGNIEIRKARRRAGFSELNMAAIVGVTDGAADERSFDDIPFRGSTLAEHVQRHNDAPGRPNTQRIKWHHQKPVYATLTALRALVGNTNLVMIPSLMAIMCAEDVEKMGFDDKKTQGLVFVRHLDRPQQIKELATTIRRKTMARERVGGSGTKSMNELHSEWYTELQRGNKTLRDRLLAPWTWETDPLTPDKQCLMVAAEGWKDLLNNGYDDPIKQYSLPDARPPGWNRKWTGNKMMQANMKLDLQLTHPTAVAEWRGLTDEKRLALVEPAAVFNFDKYVIKVKEAKAKEKRKHRATSSSSSSSSSMTVERRLLTLADMKAILGPNRVTEMARITEQGLWFPEGFTLTMLFTWFWLRQPKASSMFPMSRHHDLLRGTLVKARLARSAVMPTITTTTTTTTTTTPTAASPADGDTSTDDDVPAADDLDTEM